MELSGKNVCFVACFGGIGFETCKILMSKGLKTMILLDRIYNQEAMNELKALDPNCTVLFYRFDVTRDSKKLKSVIEDVERIDVFVYGAGISNDHDIELSVQVNFVGLMNALLVVLPHMDKSKGGKGGMIVAISSVLGLDPLPGMPVYSGTKSAIISAIRSLAHPTISQQTGVSLMAICPTITKTALLSNMPTFLNLDEHFSKTVMKLPAQNAEDCAQNIVLAIEKAQNNSVWLLDAGKLELMELKQFWFVPEDMVEALKIKD